MANLVIFPFKIVKKAKKVTKICKKATKKLKKLKSYNASIPVISIHQNLKSGNWTDYTLSKINFKNYTNYIRLKELIHGNNIKCVKLKKTKTEKDCDKTKK